MSIPSTSPSSATIAEYHLTGGPRWYRTRIRLFGPILGVAIPGAVALAGFASLRLSDASWSGPLGLVAAYLGAPVLAAIGAPFDNRSLYPVAVIASMVIWLLIGLLASRRATRNPMATWSDFWRHYAWMLGGMWVGTVVALAIAGVRIGDTVLDW